MKTVNKIVNSIIRPRWVKLALGALLTAAGLWILLKNVYVATGRFDSLLFTIGPLRIRSGILVFPLAIGLVWMIFDPKSRDARNLSVAGFVIIVVYAVLSVSIRVGRVPILTWIGMLVLLICGFIFLRAGLNNEKLEIKL